MRTRFKYIRSISIFTFAILIFGLVIIYSQHKASADAYSWINGTLTGERRDDITDSSHNIDYGWCTGQKVTYSAPWFIQNPTADACVFQAKSFRYAIFNTNWTSGLFVSIGTDQKMYHVDNVGFASFGGVRPSPNTDDFIFGQTVWKDLPSKLTRVTGTYGEISYNPTEFYKVVGTDELGNGHDVYTSTVSHNGEWEIMNVANLGYVRVNLQDFSMKWIAPFQHQHETTNISNDGRFVVVTSYGVGTRPPTIFDLDSCGQNASKIQSSWFGTTLQSPCSSRDLTDVINNTLGTNYNTFDGVPDFSDDGWKLSVFTRPNGNGTPGKGVELNAAGYTSPRLDYLALGDSYSSGEGDTEIDQYGKKHYRSHTDVEENQVQGQPREKCHISTRSYPYKLAQFMGLTNNSSKQWDTVACSGAQTYDADTNNSSYYLGQGKGAAKVWDNGKTPRLEGYGNAATLRVDALNEFIPGRQKQIAFVAKYKPRAVTLTMGGNDVDFAGKLSLCVVGIARCSIASPEGRVELGKEIRSQFQENLTPFYQELKTASPSTKFYILGYPEAINPDQQASCKGTEAAGIDSEERRAIYEGYDYMNKIIEAAAARAGFKYIDVENALDSHRLCDYGSDRYITGITTGLGNFGRNERQESFHPNAEGHSAIYEKIREKLVINQVQYSPLTYPYTQQEDSSITAPAPEGYLANPNNTPGQVQSKNMVSDAVKKTSVFDIILRQFTFQSNSFISASLHSDPLDLGTFTANSDGSLDVQVAIPATFPTGYHTLILTGNTYSGEPIEYEQVIFVYSDPNDVDEDGISDNLDLCLFVQPLNQDVDLDGQDDACDPYVDSTPRPVYRLRSGDLARTYQGSVENTNYLYLERNIYASNITSISGDDDPDDDGYTVIAASQAGIPNGRYANLQINTSSTPDGLYVSFRTAENGCVQYQPSDLSQVTSNSSYRTFTQQAADTNTCRSQLASDDLDNNNQPDNTQPLYLGRNGDPSKGEVVTKLYLFRSTRGAESQLGISDYAPFVSSTPQNIPVNDSTDYRQPWSLVASTQSNPLVAVTYKTIHMVGNVPYVVAKTNVGGLCQAYKPANTGTIKQSTQNIINLTLDIQQTLNAVIGGWCG